MDAIRVQFLMWPIIDIISVISVCAIYFAGIHWLGTGGITTGIIIAFTSYVWRFWEPVINLGNFYNSIINAVAYLERIFETIDEKPTVADLPGAVTMPSSKWCCGIQGRAFLLREG